MKEIIERLSASEIGHVFATAVIEKQRYAAAGLVGPALAFQELALMLDQERIRRGWVGDEAFEGEMRNHLAK